MMLISRDIINHLEKYLITENIAIIIHNKAILSRNQYRIVLRLKAASVHPLREVKDYIRISLQYNMIGSIMHNHL